MSCHDPYANVCRFCSAGQSFCSCSCENGQFPAPPPPPPPPSRAQAAPTPGLPTSAPAPVERMAQIASTLNHNNINPCSHSPGGRISCRLGPQNKREDAKDASEHDVIYEIGTSSSDNAQTVAPASATGQLIALSAGQTPDVLPGSSSADQLEQAARATQPDENPRPDIQGQGANQSGANQPHVLTQGQRLNPNAVPFRVVPPRPMNTVSKSPQEINEIVKASGIPWVINADINPDLLATIIGLTNGDNGFILAAHPGHPRFVFVYTKQVGGVVPGWVWVPLGEGEQQVEVEIPSNATMHELRVQSSQRQAGDYAIKFVTAEQEHEFFGPSMRAQITTHDVPKYALWVVLGRNYAQHPQQWASVLRLYDDDMVLSNRICEVIFNRPKRDPNFQPNPPRRRHLRSFVDKCNKHFTTYGLFVVRVLEVRGNQDQ